MKIKLKRIKREETKDVPLWYEGKVNGKNVTVSVVGGAGDTRMRIGTLEKRSEIGFPLFGTGKESLQYWHDRVQAHEKEFRETAKRRIKEVI